MTRCRECRSYLDAADVNPHSGTCYACEAIAVGDLIPCPHCGWWNVIEATRCEECGRAVAA